ncbi:HNH endonuclease signature motif containing protein [Propionibacterium freudenreichii]|uniref:HNH endonuclease signature motif containing protein n=1 Tax=Propionibacterium freudenreichii TaxID=1744 RepID=UPI003D752D79
MLLGPAARGVIMPRYVMSERDASRFWSKVEFSDCWNWIGRLDNGYGRFWVGGGSLLAHRVSWNLLVGEIPEPLQLDHLCRNRGCVNPDHLQPVDIATNVLRGAGVTAANARKTRCKRGHPLRGKNLAINTRGQRVCRACALDRLHSWRRRDVA